MTGNSWTHQMARPLVRPMIGTWIRPNHLTTLRLLSGLAAAGGIALGTPEGTLWGGVLWVISAFLDRADGELARLGKLTSPGGHVYDYYSDFICNAVFFVAIGVGLRHSWLAEWAIPLGLLSGSALFLVSLFSVWLEQRSPPGTQAYYGRWGFHPDDALYLLAPLAWLGWLVPVLLAASVVITVITVITGVRLYRLRQDQLTASRAIG
jgi:archaetidylinositol phosphate synthase